MGLNSGRICVPDFCVLGSCVHIATQVKVEGPDEVGIEAEAPDYKL